MNGKSSLVLYHDIREPLELLSDEERGRLFLAILNYSEFGEVPEFSGALSMAFAFIRNAVDRDAAAWEDKREKRRVAGSMGGKQRVANQANATFAKQTEQSQANQAVPVPAPVPVPVPVPAPVPAPVPVKKDGEADTPPRARFSPPSVEEVSAYCRERRNGVDAQRFVDYYTANGWRVGKNSMKDWRAAVRNWERRESSAGRSNSGYGSEAPQAAGITGITWTTASVPSATVTFAETKGFSLTSGRRG